MVPSQSSRRIETSDLTGDGEKTLLPFSIPAVWTWKESQQQVRRHPKSSIWGDVEGCWIKYDDESSAALETAYRGFSLGILDQRMCNLPTYTIDLMRMIQTNRTTGFRRKVQRHVGFHFLLEQYYGNRRSKIYDASECCELLVNTTNRIENTVKESIDRDLHFGVYQQQTEGKVLPRTVKYFRQKQTRCFLKTINDCGAVFELCCERAGVSSKDGDASMDDRSAVECYLGEDAKDMCLAFFEFLKKRLKRFGNEEERFTKAIEQFLVRLRWLENANHRRLLELGVTRGDPSRPLKAHFWNEEYVMVELSDKIDISNRSSFRAAFNLRSETKVFLSTLNKYLESRQKMDARYQEIDEFQLIARQSLQTDSGGLVATEVSNGDFIMLKPEYQQQAISGKLVSTMDELFEAASAVEPLFQDLIERTLRKLDRKMDRTQSYYKEPIVLFASLKSRSRASEKAHDDYSKCVPGPAFSWLYDIVRGSIEFHSAVEVITFVDMLEKDPSIHIVKAKNRFENPSLTGYRDLCIQFQISVNGRFKHVCELQIHHHAIKVLDKELRTHQYYEHFRSYFAGSTSSLKERLEDLRLIGGRGTVDEDYLHSLLPSCTDEERLERLGTLFELQLTEYDWALKAYANLLGLRIEKFGNCHPAVAKTYCNIGNVMKARGKLEDAMLYYKASLRSDRSAIMVLASTHRGMAATMALLKQTDDAIELFESAVEMIGVEDSPFAVETSVEMANLYRDHGDFIRSMQLYEKALEVTKSQYGEEHQNVGSILLNMARILSRKGELDSAIELYHTSLEISKKSLGQDHLSAAEIYQCLGLIFQQREELFEASKMYEKALDMYQTGLGEWHTLVADSYDMLASVHWQEGRFFQARALHGQARRTRFVLEARSNTPESVFSGIVGDDLSLNVTKNNVGEDHPYFAFGLDCKARFLLHSENPEKALLPFQKLVEIIKRTFGEKHVLLANAYQSLGTLLRRLGQLDEALEVYQNFHLIVENVKETKFAIEHCSEWAKTYEEMAGLLQERSRISGALGAILPALQMRKQIALDSNLDMIQTLSTFKKVTVISDRAMEDNHDNEALAAEGIDARKRVIADGLDLYHGLVERHSHRNSRTVEMLLDTLVDASKSFEEIHCKISEVQSMTSAGGNEQELLSKVAEILIELRSPN